MNKNIIISKLPTEIRRQIPLSIRSYKDVYEYSELPVEIQLLVKKYYDQTPTTISYKKVYDIKPEISEYSDFKIISSLENMVLEYLKTYLLVAPGSYPFDPTFGCKLKYYLQTKDTNLRQTLISSEIERISEVLTADVGAHVLIESIDTKTVSDGVKSEVIANIIVKIDGKTPSKLSMRLVSND